MEKYITIPAEELKGREKRAFPNGKQVLNPEWVAAQPAPTLDATAEALLAAGGETVGDTIVVQHSFEGTSFPLCYRDGEFLSGGAFEDSAIANLRRQLGI